MLVGFLGLSALFAWLLSQAASPGEVLLFGALLAFFNLGAWGVLYTYTPELYPTAIRALGSGYAAGFGRIGSMIAPAMVGMLIGGQMGSASIFMLFAGVFVVVSAVVMGLGVESRKKSLEEIAEEAVESGRATVHC